MPNWSHNRMEVQIDDENRNEVKRLRDLITVVEVDDKTGEEFTNHFCFDKVIPMPEDLDIPAMVVPKHPTDAKHRELLRKQKENLRKYGYKDWYDWRIAKWDTKWDAVETSDEFTNDEELVIIFDTAWSFPTAVVVELSKQFPTIEFTYLAEEESGMYNFVVRFKNGEVIYYAEMEGVGEQDEFGEYGDYEEVEKSPEEFWK